MTISLVTPSFNQAAFLEATLRSVLDQGFAGLDYAVVDGGSTDGSVDIVRRYADRLSWWASEPDAGQYDAINKGFARSSGEVMGWLNSDDLHLPWTLSLVAQVFAELPEVRWLTTRHPLVFDAAGRCVRAAPRGPWTSAEFRRGIALPAGNWPSFNWIQQESTFWRRSLWDEAGGSLDTSLGLAADFDLWMRFSAVDELYFLDAPVAGFRRHGDQKTGRAPQRYGEEALDSFRRHGGRAPVAPLARLALLARRAGVTKPKRTVRWQAETGRFAVVAG
jgi:glycosyltransferase involved in cell wall biosynthesis